MKKLKKLVLKKEVISMLGGREMNLVKGGDAASNCYCDTDGCAGGTPISVWCASAPPNNNNITTGGTLTNACYPNVDPDPNISVAPTCGCWYESINMCN